MLSTKSSSQFGSRRTSSGIGSTPSGNGYCSSRCWRSLTDHGTNDPSMLKGVSQSINTERALSMSSWREVLQEHRCHFVKKCQQRTPLDAAHRSRHDHILAVLLAGSDDCKACDVPSCTWDTRCLQVRKRQSSSAVDILVGVGRCVAISRRTGCLVASLPGHL